MSNYINLYSQNSPSPFDLIFILFCILTITGACFLFLDNSLVKGFLKKDYFGGLKLTIFKTRFFFLHFNIIIILLEVIQIQFLEVVPINYASFIIASLAFLFVLFYNTIKTYKSAVAAIVTILMFAYQFDILAKIYNTGNNLAYFGTFIILLYAATIVIKNQLLYTINCMIAFGAILALFNFDKITYLDFCIYVISISGVIFITFGKRLSLINSLKSLEFSKNLIDNSTSLLCAFDKYGNLLYSNNAINTMLGYTFEETKGKQFWVLTQDPDFIEVDYNELYQPRRTYVKKLTSKSGELHYILWSEKKMHENLFISSGQDITLSYLQQQDYQILFDNLSEIYFELDNQGRFKRINNYAVKACGYHKNELDGTFFKDLIFTDDLAKVTEHYSTISKTILNFKPVEFRVITKNGGFIWVSQIVNTKLNVSGNIEGFAAVARVITEEKEIQLKQIVNSGKSIAFQNLINDLYTSKFHENDLATNVKYIFEIANTALKVDRIFVCKYNEDGISVEFINLFSELTSTIGTGDVISKECFPKYYASIEHYNKLILSDVRLHESTSELYTDYFEPNKIKSLIHQVIKINGAVDRIICFEDCYYRDWTEEEIRFTNSVANYLALTMERNEKSKIEHLLNKRGTLLNALNNINSQLIKSKNFADVLNCDYRAIGEILNVSRFFFFEFNRTRDNYSLKHKWCAASVSPNKGMHSFEHFKMDSYPEIQNQFEEKGYFSASANDCTSKEVSDLLQKINIKTLLFVPLYLNKKIFGFVGLDDLHKVRKWNQNDTELLKTFTKNLEFILERIKYLEKIKKSEQKFELLAKHVPAGVYIREITSQKTLKLFVNSQLEKITGYSANDFYESNISLVDLYHQDDREMAIREKNKAIAEKGSYKFTARIIQKTGDIVKIEESGGTIVVYGKVAYLEGIIIAIP